MQFLTTLRRTILTCALVLLPCSAFALDSILVIPTIPGNSYSGALSGPGTSIGSQVIAFVVDADRAYSFQSGTGGSLGTYGGAFRVVKISDDATIPLGQRLAMGTFIPSLEIRFIVGADTLTYEFATVAVTRINTAGSLDGPFDEVTFVPCSMRVTSTNGSVAAFEWNFQTNEPEFPGTCVQ